MFLVRPNQTKRAYSIQKKVCIDYCILCDYDQHLYNLIAVSCLSVNVSVFVGSVSWLMEGSLWLSLSYFKPKIAKFFSHKETNNQTTIACWMFKLLLKSTKYQLQGSATFNTQRAIQVNVSRKATQ